MKILTEPIGSVPRPVYMRQAMAAFAGGQIKADELDQPLPQASLLVARVQVDNMCIKK